MNGIGFIKMYRSLLGWEWYKDINVKTLFIHCLFKANYKDVKFQGKDIKAGSFVTSLEILGLETSLSVQQIRTSLNKLKSTGELTVQSTNKGTVITVLKWEDYQGSDEMGNTHINKPPNKRITNEQQTDNKRITTIKEVKKERSKEDKNKYKELFDIFVNGNDELLQKLNDYYDMRIQTKSKMTDRAVQSFLTKLTNLSKGNVSAQMEMLDNATISNWKSVYPLDNRKQQSQQKSDITMPKYSKVVKDDPEELRKLRERIMKGD